MYTGSHLRLILTILLVPSVFVFLIAADYENRNLLSEQEITVSEIKIKDNGDDLLLTEENKVIIKKRRYLLFYSGWFWSVSNPDQHNCER